jgi:putative ABC transport system permease protein
MELGPVLRALVHNRVRFWLISIEVALTLAIVVNCVSLALDQRERFLRDPGIDVDNLLLVRLEPFAEEYGEESYRRAARERDLERLRAFPGVRAATAIAQVPLSGGGSATGRKWEGAEGNTLPAPYFLVSDGALQTLGVELVAGRDFQPGDYELETNEMGDVPDQPALLSRPLADKLFPDGDALGKRIVDSQGESSNIVVGILAPMHNSWPQWEEAEGHSMLLPGAPESDRRIHYLVRAEEGSREAVMGGLEELLLGLDNGRIVTLRTMDEVKRATYGGELSLVKLLSAVVVLLVLVTALGIVGLTSFSVSQRRRQIGTRRALGATQRDILRYFLLENWLVTGSGLALGLGLAFALNYALVKVAEAPKLDWSLLAGGMALLWVSGILAALVPALRAARVAPVVATRSV